jgi:hypothetical protein
MGPARQAAKNRKVRGRQGSKSRGGRNVEVDADRAVGAGATADLGERQPVGSDAIGEGISHTGLGKPNFSVTSTPTDYLSLRLKAVLALEKLLDDPAAPANVRASAARTLLELVGAIGGRAKREGDQDLNDLSLEPETMSLQDIDRELLRLGEV